MIVGAWQSPYQPFDWLVNLYINGRPHTPDDDFAAYDSDVDATLAAKLDALHNEQLVWEAKKPSKTRTKKLKSLEEKIEETRQIRANKNLREAYYLNAWRTFQLSDHLPLWVELDVDFTADYLDNL